nr:MAG TPA: hypothetical protein [Caudoviricetes sp.]
MARESSPTNRQIVSGRSSNERKCKKQIVQNGAHAKHHA